MLVICFRSRGTEENREGWRCSPVKVILRFMSQNKYFCNITQLGQKMFTPTKGTSHLNQ